MEARQYTFCFSSKTSGRAVSDVSHHQDKKHNLSVTTNGCTMKVEEFMFTEIPYKGAVFSLTQECTV